MSKIIRYEFVGSWIWLGLLCLTGIGIPIALFYGWCSTVRIESEMDNPEEVMYRFRTRKLPAK